MKAFKSCFLFLPGLLLFLCSPAFPQQYTLRDQQEIAHQAQLTLNMYQDLLNVIAYAELATSSEIKEMIRNSYSPSRSQLFYSEAAIIEDNIRPSNLESKQRQDKTVKEYLKHFDLAYEKSDKETVNFFDFEVSHLKHSTYPYIKVKYTCLFEGKHKEEQSPYKAVERVAEFRAERRDNKWKTFITSIIYYDPENPIDSRNGDVELEETVPAEGAFSHYSEIVRSKRKETTGERTQEEVVISFSWEQDSLFHHHMKAGEAALVNGKPEEAYAAFVEAEKINPHDQDLRQKLLELAQAQNQSISSGEKSFEQLKRMAEKALYSRDYGRAKNFYTEAFRLRSKEEELKIEIEKLDRIIQNLALLESKYAVGAYEEAIADYNKAIRDDRTNPDYYYGRGKSFEKLKFAKEALNDYTKAIELDGNFMEALSSRARLYAETGQFHKAMADYALILSNPDYADEYYPERAQVRLRMGDRNGALEDYDAAIQRMPDAADLYFRKGMILFEQKKIQAAANTFSEAITKDPKHSSSYAQRGLSYAALGNLQQASQDFEKARELGLEEAQLGQINKLALHYYKKAEGALAEKSYRQALKSFEDALLISPAFGRAWLRKGDAHFQLQEYDSAISNYGKAIEYDPVSLAYFKRGQAYQEKGDYPSASNDFNNFLPVGSELLARSRKGSSAQKSAASLLENFIEDRADAYYALGYAQLMTNQFVEALENLNMAIHVRKFFPKAYFARGAALYALEEYKGAVKNMEESIRMGLSDPLVFYSLGRAYVASDQIKEAIFSLSHALELDPDYVAAYKERAYCYKKYQQYDLALQDVHTALSLNKGPIEDAGLMAQKGLLELHVNKLQEAKQSFEHALRLDENNGWALYGKACALAKEQKMKESLEFYRKAFLTKEIEWPVIKNDPLIQSASQQQGFKELVKTYL